MGNMAMGSYNGVLSRCYKCAATSFLSGGVVVCCKRPMQPRVHGPTSLRGHTNAGAAGGAGVGAGVGAGGLVPVLAPECR